MDLSKDVIMVAPLDALKNMLEEVEAGRIRLERLELETTAAHGGRLDFVFRGEAVACLSPNDLSAMGVST